MVFTRSRFARIRRFQTSAQAGPADTAGVGQAPLQNMKNMKTNYYEPGEGSDESELDYLSAD